MISKRIGGGNISSKSHMVLQEPGYAFKKISPAEMGLKFSSEKLLLTTAFVPVSYQLSLASEKKLSLTLSVHEKFSGCVLLSVSSVSLSKKNKRVTVEVTPLRACNMEVELLHSHASSETYCVLSAYVLGSEGIELRTAGSDFYFQLSHTFSVKRFSEEVEAALEGTKQTGKITGVVRPTPEVVKDNTVHLLLQSEANTCYTEYPYWVGIDMGELHGLAVTKDGRLYSWGTGIFGQLGIELDTFKTQQQAIIDAKAKKHWYPKITEVALESSLPNNVRERIENSHKIAYIAVSPGLSRVPLQVPVQAVACGLYHSVVLSNNGVFSFGLGESGRLGQGSEQSSHLPQPVELPERCLRIACGYHNSFFVLESNLLYSCGSSSEGSSGHEADKYLPSQVTFVQNVVSVSSACTHTAVVTLDGRGLLFGSNEDNKLGGHSPHFIEQIEGQKLRGLYCGGRHTCALTDNFEIYAWGHNSCGQLGLSSTMFHSMASPVKVEYLNGRCVVDMSLGWEHSCAITVDGILYSWGSNAKGQLGIGTLAKEFKRVGLPRLVDQLLGNPVTCIGTSRYGSIFITAEEHPENNSSVFHTWKNSLLAEEKHIQELANYRFSLLIRDLRRDQLINKIQNERGKELGKKNKVPGKTKEHAKKPKTEKKPTMAEGYYSFWEDKSVKEKKNDRVLYKYNVPGYFKEKVIRTVTVFGKPGKKPIQEKKQTLDLRDVVTFASVQGAEIEPIIGVSHNENQQVDRPVYYERIAYQPEFKYTPSDLYPFLFHPYRLLPNPTLIVPTKKTF